MQGRVVAVILAVAWATMGFGVIDLETAIPPDDPVFRGRWFLKGSNGLILTVFVIAPLEVVALHPSRSVWCAGSPTSSR